MTRRTICQAADGSFAALNLLGTLPDEQAYIITAYALDAQLVNPAPSPNVLDVRKVGADCLSESACE